MRGIKTVDAPDNESAENHDEVPGFVEKPAPVEIPVDESAAEIAALTADFDTEPNDSSSELRVTDARLVDEAKKGRQRAFGVLVQRYERRLIRVISRFIRDPDLVEDLAQETFIRVYEKLDQFDTSRRFGPWLFRVGVNLTLDHLRRKKRRGWIALFSEQPNDRFDGRSYDPGQDDPRRAADESQEVRHVLDGIPEKYRTVLVLRDLENFSTSEIAAILNRKEATIRWRLAEARSRFEELWRKREQEPPRPSLAR